MDFEESVLSCVRRIPPGRVMSYGDVARAAGFPRYARQVGRVLGRTGGSESGPEAQPIPWHRVIRADGRSGLGEQGAQRQMELLRQEGIQLEEDRVPACYRWLDLEALLPPDPQDLG